VMFTEQPHSTGLQLTTDLFRSGLKPCALQATTPTTSYPHNLTVTRAWRSTPFISPLAFELGCSTVLAIVAEFESDLILIRLRTREGMKVAKAKGRDLASRSSSVANKVSPVRHTASASRSPGVHGLYRSSRDRRRSGQRPRPGRAEHHVLRSCLVDR
jgi:hypothetical protein